MTRSRGYLGLVLIAATMMSCGGSDSTLPSSVRDQMRATEAALEEGDGYAACDSLRGIGNALYEWQSFARGNQPMLIEKLLRGLEFVSGGCMGRQLVADDTEIDVEQLQDRYTEWAAETGKNTQRKSGFMHWLLYILVPLVLGGFLMYWRRKFREA